MSTPFTYDWVLFRTKPEPEKRRTTLQVRLPTIKHESHSLQSESSVRINAHSCSTRSGFVQPAFIRD